ncbi:MAG: hypothetical protein IJN14_06545 [Ruminococcus sp.]|nr:hypothetical protein [Ruminococcus sp.]
MDERFEKVIAVKRRSHRSWKNFYASACKQLGLSYDFGTEKVEKSSESYLNSAVIESGMTIADIKEEIEKRNLI